MTHHFETNWPRVIKIYKGFKNCDVVSAVTLISIDAQYTTINKHHNLLLKMTFACTNTCLQSL